MKKLGGKKVIVGVLSAAMVMGGSMTALAAAGWNHNTTGWWYEYSNGSYAANKWEQVNGVWYFFDANGYMSKGWINDNGNWYFANSDGAMQTGWVCVNNEFYYLNPVSDGTKGAMKTGSAVIDGVTYTFDASGACMNSFAMNTQNIPSYYADGTKYSAANHSSGGSGKSTGGSSSSSSVSSTVKQANQAMISGVQDAVKNAGEDVVSETNEAAPIKSVTVSDVTNTNVKNVNVTLNPEKKEETKVSDVSGAFVGEAKATLDEVKPAKIEFGSTVFDTVELAKEALDVYAESGRTLDSLKESYTIKLTLSNGEIVNYVINVK